MARSPSQRTSTCLRLDPASEIVMSASVPRPMTVRARVSEWRRPSTSMTACQLTRPSTVPELTLIVPVAILSSPSSEIDSGPEKL